MEAKQLKRMPMGEDQEGLLRSADTDSSSDEAWPSNAPKPSRRQKYMSLVRAYSWLINTCLLTMIFLLQVLILRGGAMGRSKGEWQLGGDYLQQEPNFSTEVKQWKADYEFVPPNATAFLAPSVQAKWETLYPAGNGFLADSISVYNSTSVTHQLHCVYIMAKIFSAVLTKSASIPEQDDYEAHFLHCADYMRQEAMCASDLAIEPRGEHGEPAPVTLDNAFNGYHVCKKYDDVKGYLEEQLKEGKRNILPLDD